MNSGFRRVSAVMAGLVLSVSIALAGWEQLTSGTTADLYSVHFPQGTQVGYVVGDSGTILKTTDGGTTWSMGSPGTDKLLHAVYFLNDSNGFAVGAGGTVIRSGQGGAEWTTMAVTDTDMFNYVQFPQNSQIGYIGVHPVAGGGKVLRTTDGGDTWASIAVGSPTDTSISVGMATDLIGVAVGSNGFVYGTTDGFGTGAIQGPQTTADLIAVAFSAADKNKGYLIGNDSTQGIIRYTDDGGAELWDSVTVTNPVVTALYGVDIPASNIAYFCGTDGYIGKTRSPTHVERTDVPSGVTATLYDLCFPNGADTGFVVGAHGVILRTYNGGDYGAIAETETPAADWSGIRIVSNPSRYGITLHADVDVDVVVFDAVGRAVASRALTRGLNFLPLSKAGVYMVRLTTEGCSMTQKLVVEH
ncbi:T9SS type A sorting domain-containing protein [candidate division WOR-3 bacterium]|uniref:T9SS type A sorting domain-containing protein n=1 Tax=candidate division WOR-3 bacterium TaxID=2052148 RepID=A0A937XHP6_UNCW3|nr:T9SS type A sorting domain-containing protein [candidate division WOR-3 bacterium]